MATWGIWLFVIGRRTLTSDLGENGVKTLVCVNSTLFNVFSCYFIVLIGRRVFELLNHQNGELVSAALKLLEPVKPPSTATTSLCQMFEVCCIHYLSYVFVKKVCRPSFGRLRNETARCS
jgi:hypothetical protein